MAICEQCGAQLKRPDVPAPFFFYDVGGQWVFPVYGKCGPKSLSICILFGHIENSNNAYDFGVDLGVPVSCGGSIWTTLRVDPISGDVDGINAAIDAMRLLMKSE